MPAYDLTAEAEEDLREIWRYSQETWGEDQALRYMAQIDVCCETLKSAPTRNVKEADGPVRSRQCQHHIIHFIDDADGILIIAILHERKTLLARLKDRL